MHGGVHGGEVGLCLLPTFGVESPGQAWSVGVTASKALAYLALQEQPVDRTLAAGTLWPHVSDGRAAANLRTTLWRISQSVPVPVIEASGSSLRIAAGVSIDHRQAIRTAREILGRHRDDPETHTDDDVLRTIAPLMTDLLVNWYDDWLVVHQERWRQLRLHALDALATALTASGRYALAIDAATASVDGEPLRESGYRCLMQAHLAQGNVSEVIRTHRRYRDLLHRELGVRPSHQMSELLDEAIGV